MFFWNCFIYDPMCIGNLISGSSVFSKSNLNICKFLVHILLKPTLENFEHYFASMWDECNYAVVWTLFDIAFLWDWDENWPFPVLWPLLSFPNLLAYGVQHFNSILSFRLPKFFLHPGLMVSLKFHPLRKIMVWKKLSGQKSGLPIMAKTCQAQGSNV